MGSAFDGAIELLEGLQGGIQIKVHEDEELPGVDVERGPEEWVLVRGNEGADLVEVLLVAHMNHLLSVNGWVIAD
jgi:hypothetical protein